MSWLSLGIEGKQLGRAMTRLTFTGNLGNIISPFMAGALSSLSPRYPLYGAAVLFAAIGILLMGAALALPRIRSDQHRGRSRREEPDEPDRSTSLRFPAWVGLFATYTVLGVIITVFPMYARDDLGLSKSTIGALLLCRALCTAAGYLFLGRITSWHFRPFPMTAGLALLAVLGTPPPGLEPGLDRTPDLPGFLLQLLPRRLRIVPSSHPHGHSRSPAGLGSDRRIRFGGSGLSALLHDRGECFLRRFDRCGDCSSDTPGPPPANAVDRGEYE